MGRSLARDLRSSRRNARRFRYDPTSKYIQCMMHLQCTFNTPSPIHNIPSQIYNTPSPCRGLYITTPLLYTFSIHLLNTSSQHTIPLYQLNTPSQYTLSSPPSHHTLSTPLVCRLPRLSRCSFGCFLRTSRSRQVLGLTQPRGRYIHIPLV